MFCCLKHNVKYENFKFCHIYEFKTLKLVEITDEKIKQMGECGAIGYRWACVTHLNRKWDSTFGAWKPIGPSIEILKVVIWSLEYILFFYIIKLIFQ